MSGSTSTFYFVDYTPASPVIIYNQNFVYQSYKTLPVAYSYTLKYASSYFYLTANSAFYKTDMNFNLVTTYSLNANYRAIAYDCINTIFYVANPLYYRIDIFDTNLNLKSTLSTSSSVPFGLNIYNGNIYFANFNSAVSNVFVFQNNAIANSFPIKACASYIQGIDFDNYGNMAISCGTGNAVLLYNSNGVYQNLKLSTTGSPFIPMIDSTSRLIITELTQFNVYY